MKILAFSDTHNKAPLTVDLIMKSIAIEQPDVIVIAGDFLANSHVFPKSDFGQCVDFEMGFIPFCQAVGIPVVIIPGNHDYIEPSDVYQLLFKYDLSETVHFLVNDSVEIDGKIFYGSPLSTPFCGWNYNVEEEGIYKMCARNMPIKCDVFITHSPPHGHNDIVGEDNATDNNLLQTASLGSRAVYKIIDEYLPKWVICGHIHTGSHRVSHINNSKVVNVSILNESYQPQFEPFVFEI